MTNDESTGQQAAVKKAFDPNHVNRLTLPGSGLDKPKPGRRDKGQKASAGGEAGNAGGKTTPDNPPA